MTRFTALVGSVVVAMTATASAQIFPSFVWNAIANTGAVDEADASIYLYNSTGSVAIRSGVIRATLDIRYNVSGLPIVPIGEPPDPEQDGVGHCVALRAVYRGTGRGARVIVKLQQLDLFRGTGITTLGVID